MPHQQSFAGIEELEARLLLSVLYVDDTAGQYQQYSSIQAAVNAATAGDTIYIKEGTYRETVTLSKAGTAAAPIKIAAFPGDEGKVVLAGTSNVVTWRRATSAAEVDGNANWANIWIADVSTDVNQVFRNGEEMKRSRFSNSGWLYATGLDSANPKTSFYATNLKKASNYWVGAYVHMKTAYWETTTRKITAFDPTTGKVTLDGQTMYNITRDYGYYITNIVGEINADGEWAYDPSGKKLYFMSTSGAPQGIEISSRDYGLNVTSTAAHTQVSGLYLLGHRTAGVQIVGARNITLSNSTIHGSAQYGIWTSEGSNVVLSDNYVSYSGFVGIRVDNTAYIQVVDNTVYASGTDKLGGDLYFGKSAGIRLRDSEGAVISRNVVDTSGYNGIEIINWGTAKNREISYNHVTNTMLALDDGAGIYMFAGPIAASGAYDYIHHNIVEDSYGYFGGTPRDGQPREDASQAYGIYLDTAKSHTNHVKVYDNTVINSYHSGLFLHDATDIIATNNTLYGNWDAQMLVTHWGTDNPNVSLSGNILFSTASSQITLRSKDVDGIAMTSSNSNYFHNAGNTTDITWETSAGKERITLDTWRSRSGQDKSSVKIATTSKSQILTNPSMAAKTFDLGSQTFVDAKGNLRTGKITLGAFESVVLLGQVQVDLPVADPQSLRTDEDQSLTGQLTGKDPSGKTLTFSLTSGAKNGSVTVNANGSFTYTPAANYNGSDSFAFTVSNGSATSTAVVTLTVSPVNDAPTANILSAIVENGLADGKLSGQDLDGDALSFVLIEGPKHGTVTFQADGTFRYQADASYAGTDRFTYAATDGQAQSAPATVTLGDTQKTWIEAENAQTNAPWTIGSDTNASGGQFVGTPDDRSAQWAPVAAQTFTFTFDVAQDGQYALWARTLAPHDRADSFWVSVDGGAWVRWDLTIADDWTWNRVSDQATGTPLALNLSAGAHSVAFGFREGGAAMDRLLVTNSAGYVPTGMGEGAEPANQPPTAADVRIEGDEDTVLAGQLAGTDANGDSLTYRLTSDAIDGLTVNADGSFTYTPKADWNGTLTFGYVVSDGRLESAQATATLVVRSVNDAPAGKDLALTGSEDQALAGTLMGSDLDGDALSYELAGAPGNGTVTLNANGGFTYTPAENFHGTDSFTYIVSDGQARSEAHTVTLTVQAVNDLPTADNASAAGDEDTTLTGLLPVHDADGDAFTPVLVQGPANGTVELRADGSFLYTPAANFHGTDSFTYCANDGTGDSAVCTVSLTVRAVNDAPVAGQLDLSVKAGQKLTATLPGSDADGETLTFSLGTAATNGTVTVNADGTFTYQPKAGFSGADSFTFVVSDGALSAIGTVKITVAAPTTLELEAENAKITAPWQILSDSSASGGQYINVTDQTLDYWNVPTGTDVTFTFSVAQEGQYYIWGRTQAPTDRDNSLWVSIDGGKWMRWELPVAKSWAWNKLNNSTAPVTATLSAGTHTITVKLREAGTRLDKLLVTDDAALTPANEAPKPPVHTVYAEAEKAALTSPWQVVNDPKASAGQYVTVPGPMDAWSPPAGMDVTFSVNVQQDGRYMFWGRTLSPTLRTNSFWVSVDGGEWLCWDLPVQTDWTWNPVMDRNGAAPLAMDLLAGTHTVVIKLRESGTALDQLMLTNDPTIVPANPTPAPTTPLVEIEAESGKVNSPWQVVSDTTASGGQYINVTDQTLDYWSVPTSADVSYTFTVSQSGSYSFWGRINTASNRDNSVYVSIDGGAWMMWDMPVANGWAWSKFSAATSTLSAGTHTLTLKLREAGTKLDKLLLAGDDTYTPMV